MRALLVTWGATLLLLGLAAAGLAFWPEPDATSGPATTDRAEPMAHATPAEAHHEAAERGTHDAPPAADPSSAEHASHAGPAAPVSAVEEHASAAIPEEAHGDGTVADTAHAPHGSVPTPSAEGGAADEAADAPATIGRRDDGLPLALAPAPDPALIERTPEGLLPVRGADGRLPWQAYSRPFLADPGTPKIALVVIGLGLSSKRTRAAIEKLPAEVTLAFSPYGRRLQDLAREARAHGHETLVMVPMEPGDYPANDPGPLGLLTELTPAQNLQRLRRVLGRFAGHVGIVNDMGSRFTAERGALAPIVAEIGRRGLLMLDARTTARSRVPELARRYGVPFARNDRYIDNVARADEIDRYLAELETLARRRGSAVGIARAYPVTIARIRAFAEGLETRGLVLAPLSAVVEIPATRNDGS